MIHFTFTAIPVLTPLHSLFEGPCFSSGNPPTFSPPALSLSLSRYLNVKISEIPRTTLNEMEINLEKKVESTLRL